MALLELRTFSHALQKQTTAFVIHPDADVPGPYHVMFLLHGLSDDHSIWLRRTSIERYVQGLPLIVVMPDGGRGFYTDAVAGAKFFTAIGEEMPAFIEHFFRPEGKWCATGLSMGGYGAIKLALRRPDRFVSAVSHSGALMFGRLYPSPSDSDRDPAFTAEFLRVTGPVTGPGGPDDLVRLAAEAQPFPSLRIDCGTEDFLLGQNRGFHAELRRLRLPHEYEEFPGDHNWEYWDAHVQEAIAFHRKAIGF